MNKYQFDELSIGHLESFSTIVSKDKVDKFRDITGDLNPLHLDDSFARGKGFNGKVVYGLLTSAFFSTLVGMYLPGERCLIQEVKYKYMKPVYYGDELVVSGEIINMDDRTKQLMLKVYIERKQDGTKVVRGTMTVGVLE